MPVTIEELPPEEVAQEEEELLGPQSSTDVRATVTQSDGPEQEEEEQFFDACSDDDGPDAVVEVTDNGIFTDSEPETCTATRAGCTVPDGPTRGKADVEQASGHATEASGDEIALSDAHARGEEFVVNMAEPGSSEIGAPCITDAGNPQGRSDANGGVAEGGQFECSRSIEAKEEVVDASPEVTPVSELSEEEKQVMLKAAEALKQEGNRLFGQQHFNEASQKYTEAVIAAPPDAPEAAVYYANRAACMMKMELWKDAVDDCTHALKLKEDYVKALLRRCASYEKTDDMENALLDAKKVAELEPGNREAAATASRLEPIVNERREKLKDEMMGKLKDLGNVVLGKFGLSLDNFQTVQDPATGGYSINFKQ